MTDSLPLGTRIRRARERKRWSQQRLADEIGVGVRSVGNWERGVASPRSSMGALEAALGPLEDVPLDPREEELRDLGADRGGFLEPGEVEQLVARYRRRITPAARAG